jgi:hypothetical protein
MEDLKRAMEEKKQELQAYFDKLVQDGCTAMVLEHDLLPGKSRAVDVYREFSGSREITRFIVDALIVLRVVPVVDGSGNISRWRFRLYFRPIGWDDGFHNHHRMEIVDYRQRFEHDPPDVIRESYVYMINNGDRAMFVQSYPRAEPDEQEIIRDAKDWQAYKAERADYFERLEQAALQWELDLMREEDEYAI